MTENSIYQILGNQSPMAVDEYFRTVMYHPLHGYYHRKIPMGRVGDYVTAPEISQVFGELIGLWCMDVWQKLNCPKEIALMELGPGRGTMMADLMRIAPLIPAFAQAVKIHLLEASPTLKGQQQTQLQAYPVTWHEDLTDLPAMPTIFIANEFFDALPHKQYQTQHGLWYERLINCHNETLSWILAPEPTSLHQIPYDQAIVEIPQEGDEILSQVSRHLSRYPGAALIIDYGADAEHGYGDTLQGLHHHQRCSPFHAPGQSDLTFHVNFHHLTQTFKSHGISQTSLTTQGNFLQKMGIMERTHQLAQNNPQATLASFRLISAQHMGQLFKVLGATSNQIQFIGF
jgi:NADH dehydrogenase [ubiquinone] 1 alpha subcomplex assembly factor 7